MAALKSSLAFALVAATAAAPHDHTANLRLSDMFGPADPPCSDWVQSCPGVVPRAPYKQTWMMNLSTIIMPCNNTGYTDPASTKGWGIVDFGNTAPLEPPRSSLLRPLLPSSSTPA
jgi:hypothetical protein